MAVIYYRFKSQKPEQISTIRFDGTGLTVFELKREIIYANKLLTATDVNIYLYSSEDPEKEFADDNEVIQRSSTVLVRRTSAGKKGKGNVLRYIAGRQRLAKFAGAPSFGAKPPMSALPLATSTNPIVAGKDGNQTEEDLVQQMFNRQDDQWNQQQAVMATAQRIDFNKPNAKLDETIPDYYICYKCGARGQHHIRNCPKNNDPNWEGVRVKKTTGIPKSHLKAIDKPEGMVDDPSQNYMVDEQGKYVVAVADKRAWERFQKIQTKHNDGSMAGEIEVEDPDLRDPVTKRLFKDPVKTKCCHKTYSRHVIEDLLIESDFKCPNCGQDEIYLDSLEKDEEMETKVKKFLEERKRKLESDANEANKRQKPNAPGLPAVPAPNPMMGMNMPFMPFPMPGQMPMPMPIGGMLPANVNSGAGSSTDGNVSAKKH